MDSTMNVGRSPLPIGMFGMSRLRIPLFMVLALRRMATPPSSVFLKKSSARNLLGGKHLGPFREKSA